MTSAAPDLAAIDPAATRPRLLPSWRELRTLAGLFLRFGSVGFAGFVVDFTVVYATKRWLGLYGAGMLSYFIAASCNFLLNRYWTFRNRPRQKLLPQWGVFMLATLPGLLFNRGTYIGLILLLPLCKAHPVLAIIAGSGAGMFANFAMANRVVFAETPPPSPPTVD